MSAFKRNAALACLLAIAACGDDMAGEPAARPGVPGLPGAHGGEPGVPSGMQPGPGAAPGDVPEAPVDCNTTVAGPRRLWRLTAAQYDNTVRDLFGIESTFGTGFPADEVVHGFNNNADLLVVTPLLADKLAAAAEDIAMRADLARLAPCVSASKDDGCLRTLANQFGERMFRRPLVPAEAERYVALAKTAGDFEAGARLMVQGFLQSPHFLYRFELGKLASGSEFALNDFEIASQLSYLLWQTTPDDMLLAAARSGQLREPAQVRLQVERMLASERARPVVHAFVFDWLGLTNMLTVPKDTARFPELTPEIRASLLAEVERFIDHVMSSPGNSLSGLLSSPVTFLDAQLAQFYGVAAPADATQPVMMPDQQRRGILTLGATMMTHARSNDSSPVHRGKLIRERLLCQTLPPPPPGVSIQPPPLDPNKTTRERYAAHSSVNPCVSCHRLMDPIGLTFEHFDGVGRFRADDNGNPIDATGEILGSPMTDGKFDGVTQLIDQLDGSPDVQQCYSLSWVRFAYGLRETAGSASQCVIKRMQAALSDSAGSLGAIFSVLTEDEQFYNRTGDPKIAPQLDFATASIAPEPTPDAPATGGEPAAPGLDVQLAMSNDWGGGYCKTYQLKNTSAEPITWSVPLEVDGKINNHWECEVSGETGMVTFTGAQHNATIQPNAMAQFGFCGMR